MGLWILERNIVDPQGNKSTVYPGNFKMITLEGSYTIFVYTRDGGLITSEGEVILESDSTYIERIKYNLNTTLNGKEVKQKYKIANDRLYKMFFIEKNSLGSDYNTWETEVWKRVVLPEAAKKPIISKSNI